LSSSGKLRVVVRSRKVPLRTVTLGPRFITHLAPIRGYATQAVVFGSILDESDVRAVEEARRVSCRLGLELEVVDRSKLGALGKLLFAFGGAPSISITTSDSKRGAGLAFQSESFGA